MIDVRIPTLKDAFTLAKLGERTFIESHGTSASAVDINDYVSKRFSIAEFEKELSDSNSVYRLIYYNNQLAGYSKIIYNSPNPSITENNVCKMERLYILKEFYNKNIGKYLFDYNVALAKTNNQLGMWLYVWTENKRALAFYEKQGFKNIGSTYFKISENHSNPNYWMYLKF